MKVLWFLFFACAQHGDAWWFGTNQTAKGVGSKAPNPGTLRSWLQDNLPFVHRTVGSAEDRYAQAKAWVAQLEAPEIDSGMWMVLDSAVGLVGWLFFGAAWGNVKTGCRGMMQFFLLVGICLLAHYVWALCYPIVSLAVGTVMAVVWCLRKAVAVMGSAAFWAQRLTGGAPEVAEAQFLGPGTGKTPETSQLRTLKRTGDAEKLLIVRRGSEAAVFQVGTDSQTIKTHGLYVPVEPDTVRGSANLVRKIQGVDRVHLCRSEACTEEGGEHFKEYAVARKHNPERFQFSQAQQGAREASQGLWEWLKGAHLSAGPQRVAQRIKELACESEPEEEVLRCEADRLVWKTGLETKFLSVRPCKEKAHPFDKCLQDDAPNRAVQVNLCSKHAHQYLEERFGDKCGFGDCLKVGSKFQHGARWCPEHEPSSSTTPRASSRRSRSRSRSRPTPREVEEDEEDLDYDYENGEDQSGRGAQDLLEQARNSEPGPGGGRSRKRAPSRSPGNTPKSRSSINKNLSRVGMLESPGVGSSPRLLEEFFEGFAEGQAEGLREDQVRRRLAQEHLLRPEELLRALVAEGEGEQALGQRGLTKFLTRWRKELGQFELERSRTDSDWSLIVDRTPDGGKDPKPEVGRSLIPPVPTSLTASSTSTPSPGLPEPAVHLRPEGGGELRIAAPGIYRGDRKAGAGEGFQPTAEASGPVAQIAIGEAV